MSRTVDARAALAVTLVLLVPLVAAGAVAGIPPADDRRPTSTGDGGPALAPAVAPEDHDVALDSARTFWSGQRLYFDGGAVVPDVGNASTGERTFQLRRVTTAGEVGPLVREFAVDAEGEAVLDTTSLEGEFVLRYAGDPVYVQDGTGHADSPPDGTAVTVENSAWEVAVQTISASWSESRVSRNEIVDLRIESNRVLYLIEVSADGLDFEDLERIFDPHFYALDHDARADEDVIVLRGGLADDVPAYFAGIDDGAYTLSIEVADADAATTAEVRVGSGDATATTELPDATATPPATTQAPPEPTPPTTAPETTTPTTTATGPTTSTSAATATAGPGATTTTGQSGFGAIGGTVGVVAAVLLLLRRRE